MEVNKCKICVSEYMYGLLLISNILLDSFFADWHKEKYCAYRGSGLKHSAALKP